MVLSLGVPLLAMPLLAAVVLCLLAIGARPLGGVFRAAYDLVRVRRMTSKLPGPPCYPIIGNALEVMVPMDEVYDRLCALTSKYGPVFRLALGHFTFAVLMHPDDMEAAMTSSKAQEKADTYAALEAILGNGLAVLGGTVWRRHRKAITPSLHFDILRDFVHIFYKRGAAFAEKLAAEGKGGKAFDASPLCGECANSTICETVMSSDVDDDDPDKRRFLDVIPRSLDVYMYRLWHPWLLVDWVFRLNRRLYRDNEDIKEVFGSFTHRLIRQKKEALKNPDSKPQRRRLAFLDHVLSSPEGAALSDQELTDEVRTFVTIASGSSMDALSFIVYILAIRQDVQERVRQELEGILGDDCARPVEYTDLPHMDYTERVIKEALRYFSVLPAFARRLTDDLALPSGYTLPRGCQVAFWLPYVHHDPQWYPEPAKFDPDRFLPENSRGRHPFAYTPFSAGPRNCVGQRYAMMFLKTVTAALVSRLHLQAAFEGPKDLAEVRLKMSLTLSLRGGANIRVCRRSAATPRVSKPAAESIV